MMILMILLWMARILGLQAGEEPAKSGWNEKEN